MSVDVCPAWMGRFLANPLRRLLQPPRAILGPHVRPGMTVLEPGPGMGYFTLPLAEAVGPSGRVIAVELQEEMIRGLDARARAAGLDQRILVRRPRAGGLDLADLGAAVDFVLAFAVIHELPDAKRAYAEIAGAMRAGARALVCEPSLHVGAATFSAGLENARRAGLHEIARPRVALSRTALLERP